MISPSERGPGDGGGGGWFAGFVVLFSVGFSADGASICPAACFCNLPSKIVYCSRRGLTAVPSGIAPDTLQLNLNANSFHSTTLQQANFTGYDDLEHLYLSECGIERIEVGTFALLTSLKWLDLSNNRIRILSADSLSGLNLQHLFLNGNRHIRLLAESFAGLVTVGLYLHDCSLVRLTPEVLAPLNSSLKYLWLNGNELDRFEVQFGGLFSTLQHLRLASNPLHCNCEVLWLKKFFDRNADVFKGAVAPSCLTPHRLRGKFFNQLSLSDFRCQSPMFNNIETTFGRRTGSLKCTASGDPAPVLYWIQPSGKTSKYSPPPDDEDARRTEGVLTIRYDDDDGVANLYGMYICIANNEAGNVTLTINVSWPLLSNRLAESSSLPRFSSEKGFALIPSADEGPSSWQRSVATTPFAASQSSLEVRTGSGFHGDGSSAPAVDADLLGRYRGQNYTFDPSPGPKSRLFTVTEMVFAVVGTHLATLGLCIAAIPIYYKARWTVRKNRAPPQHSDSPPSGYARPHHHLLHASPLHECQAERSDRQVAPGESTHLTSGGRINNRFITDYLIASGSLR